MNWLKRIFKRKPSAIELEPIYEPGDLVIVYDPYVLDGMDAHEVSRPWIATVYQSAYVYSIDIFAYQFEEGGEWYNEAWLFPAIYGTEVINMYVQKEPTKAEQIDGLLDEYRDYKAMADSFGDAEYGERQAEIEEKIKNIL
ncbi:hypothetical protein V7149_00420 [Bacillus sp. JJ1503]|uniref:hypothetical protein n=1 Tax=Bacillus sp. JJ1503 TaxID=3122956 RepID=UPI002FFE7153